MFARLAITSVIACYLGPRATQRSAVFLKKMASFQAPKTTTFKHRAQIWNFEFLKCSITASDDTKHTAKGTNYVGQTTVKVADDQKKPQHKVAMSGQIIKPSPFSVILCYHIKVIKPKKMSLLLSGCYLVILSPLLGTKTQTQKLTKNMSKRDGLIIIKKNKHIHKQIKQNLVKEFFSKRCFNVACFACRWKAKTHLANDPFASVLSDGTQNIH